MIPCETEAKILATKRNLAKNFIAHDGIKFKGADADCGKGFWFRKEKLSSTARLRTNTHTNTTNSSTRYGKGIEDDDKHGSSYRRNATITSRLSIHSAFVLAQFKDGKPAMDRRGRRWW
jgi:hypothetical protein